MDYSRMTNSLPPCCAKHDTQMVLSFYDRPGGPVGNDWVCLQCQKEERESIERGELKYRPTRFPEGAEL